MEIQKALATHGSGTGFDLAIAKEAAKKVTPPPQILVDCKVGIS
jgi:hypothetical protein